MLRYKLQQKIEWEFFFLQWSRAVLMVVRGRGKLGYLNDTFIEPAKTDPTYPIWDANNSIVMSWLVNSMTDEIQSNYLCYPTAKKNLGLSKSCIF